VPSLPLVPDQADTLSGQTIVFAGRMSSLSHAEAHALVRSLGGRSESRVTSDTTMLVLCGNHSAVRRSAAGAGRAAAETVTLAGRKIRRAELLNRRRPGTIRLLTEEDFCRLVGLPAFDSCQLYGHRRVLAIYPAIGERHLHHLRQCGLVRPMARARGEYYYGFAEVATLRRINADLERGVSFPTVVRSRLADREGQLPLDFTVERQPAKILAIRKRAPGTRHEAENLPAPETTAQAYFTAGAQIDDGTPANQERAAAAYRKALELEPGLVPAIINLATIHYLRDALAEAQILYERAIELDADFFEAHFNLGNIHHDLGRYAAAERCYREALCRQPSYADAHLYLAVTLEKLNRSEDAGAHWRAYLQLAPNGEWAELAREFAD
jgi:hypothetical protein